MRVLCKAYNSERAWKNIGNRLQVPYYQGNSPLNRTIAEWNRLPEGVNGTSLVKMHIFRKMVRKVYQ
jgi:hypothetical protein